MEHITHDTSNTSEQGIQQELIHLYRIRLDISGDLPPNKATLQLLVERHLERIPFENICLHRQREDPIRLDYTSLVEKLLVKKRGGCCLELNGLLAYLLEALGYNVGLIPCYVYAGKERGHSGPKAKFRTWATHFLLLVDNQWMVDVGLGEPPMGPLEYEVNFLQQTKSVEQITIDGLMHRFVYDPRVWKDRKGNEKRCTLLEWWIPETQEWKPRLQWEYGKTAPSPLQTSNLTAFDFVIDVLKDPKSTFARKLIVCKLTPKFKTTLSGRTLRTTNRQTSEVESRELRDEEISKVLQREFNVEIDDIDMTKSDELLNPLVWGHL